MYYYIPYPLIGLLYCNEMYHKYRLWDTEVITCLNFRNRFEVSRIEGQKGKEKYGDFLFLGINPV